MATSKQSKGFIKLEWICQNCNTRNPGPEKVCDGCGAPQPENVQFYAPAEAKIIQDENVAKTAGGGADIHCGFCGTRNPATATVCAQCGGDLKEGKARQAGREMKREAAGVDVKCTNCSEVNSSTRTRCSKCGAPLPRPSSSETGVPAAQGNATPAAPSAPPATKRGFPWIMVGGIMVCLAVICIGGYMLSAPSKSVTATVNEVYWQTLVPVQEFQAMNYSDQAGSPPPDAYNVSCYDDIQQVCEEKTIDMGNGYAEVVQECHDESQQYCSYTLDEWATIQTNTLDGNDLFPIYSEPSLSSSQRVGEQTLTLQVYFWGDGVSYVYNPDSLEEFQAFTVGSTWTLRVNALGGVVSVVSE